MAQDPLFMQLSGGNINLNPALVGNDSSARFALICRNQWPGLSGNYLTTSANFYQYIPKLNAYAGINYINDNQAHGTLITNNVSVFYSQNIQIKKVLFRPSIEIGYGNKKLDASKLNFGDMIDPRRGFVYKTNEPIWSTNKSYLNFNLGGMLYYKNIVLGFSTHHINTPDEGILGSSKLPIRYGLQIGYTLNLKKISLSPFMFYNQQQNFNSLVAGVNTVLFNHINVALAYRTAPSVLLGIGYQNKFFKLNYLYEGGIGTLNSTNTAGSHELGLVVKFWKVKPNHRFMASNNVFS